MIKSTYINAQSLNSDYEIITFISDRASELMYDTLGEVLKKSNGKNNAAYGKQLPLVIEPVACINSGLSCIL